MHLPLLHWNLSLPHLLAFSSVQIQSHAEFIYGTLNASFTPTRSCFSVFISSSSILVGRTPPKGRQPQKIQIRLRLASSSRPFLTAVRLVRVVSAVVDTVTAFAAPKAHAIVQAAEVSGGRTQELPYRWKDTR